MLPTKASGCELMVRGNQNKSLQVLPVEGWRVSLGLAAEHHFSAILARFKGKHDTAGLFGEHGPQQDSTSWMENQQNCISLDVLESLETNFYVFLPVSRFQRFYREGR